MTVEELKNMESNEVKNFIREKLMYNSNEVNEIYDELLWSSPAKTILKDFRPNVMTHKRFDMSEDCSHNSILLSKFDDLRLMQSFYCAQLKFHKGCADFLWCNKEGEGVREENLCGFGTVDIIHFIMSKAWGLEGV